METIAAENLLNELKILTPDQRIFVDFSIGVSNRLELLTYQIQSAEKLFQSFMNNTIEIAQDISLKRFLEVYADLVREKEKVFQDECIRLLGTQVFNFCSLPINRIRYYLDFHLKKLVITKNNVNQCSIPSAK